MWLLSRLLRRIVKRGELMVIDTRATHLNQALESRGTIEQAKGILMATSDVTADEAFDMLRAASQRENVKLRDVAKRIVERRSFRGEAISE